MTKEKRLPEYELDDIDNSLKKWLQENNEETKETMFNVLLGGGYTEQLKRMRYDIDKWLEENKQR